MTIDLQISSVERSANDVNAFTRNVQMEFARANGVKANLSEEPTTENAKGVATIVGGICLDVLQAGAFNEIIKVLGAYLMRDRTMTVKMKAPDGAEIEITGTNLSSHEIQTAIKTMVAEQTSA